VKVLGELHSERLALRDAVDAVKAPGPRLRRDAVDQAHGRHPSATGHHLIRLLLVIGSADQRRVKQTRLQDGDRQLVETGQIAAAHVGHRADLVKRGFDDLAGLSGGVRHRRGAQLGEPTLALHVGSLLAALGGFFLCLLILIDVGHALTLRASKKRRVAIDNRALSAITSLSPSPPADRAAEPVTQPAGAGCVRSPRPRPVCTVPIGLTT
jgi:hypothetical protein